MQNWQEERGEGEREGRRRCKDQGGGEEGRRREEAGEGEGRMNETEALWKPLA